MTYIIFHGSYGSPSSNWYTWLEKELQKLGHKVLVPQFPVEDWKKVTKDGPHIPLQNQYLRNWMRTFDSLYNSLNKIDPLCFIGHSISCVFILHLIEKYKIKLDKAIFIAPFLNALDRSWQIDYANQTFYKSDFNFDELKKYIPISEVIYSDNDPYVPMQHSIEFGEKMGGEMILLSGEGHMNEESGHIQFPLILDLCKKQINYSSPIL